MDERDFTHLRYLSDALWSAPGRAKELLDVTLDVIRDRDETDHLKMSLKKLRAGLESQPLEAAMKQVSDTTLLEFLRA